METIKENEISYGVYQILCISTKKSYVGSTIQGFNKRFKEHQRMLKSNKHHSTKLQRAWNKYGEENFSYLILEVVTDKKAIRQREKYWLDLLNTFKNGFNCSNKTDGPEVVKGLIGEKSRRAKLTNLEVAEARKRYEAGESSYDLAKIYRISATSLIRAIRGKTYFETSGEVTKRNKYFGTKSSTAKINEEQAREIITEFQNGKSIIEISEEKKLSKNLVKLLVKGITWRHLDLPREHCAKPTLVPHKRKKLLSQGQIQEIRDLLSQKEKTQLELGKMFGVSEMTISCIHRKIGRFAKC